MKRKILMLLLLLSLMIIMGCSGAEKGIRKEESDLLKSNIPYSIRENMSIVLKNKYVEDVLGKANITRRVEDKTYEIRIRDDGSLIIVTYDNGRLIDFWRLKELYERADFDGILVGESNLEDVLRIDPYTSFFEKSNEDGFSEHRLINDEAVVISYIRENESWLVDDITYKEDPVGISKIISPDYFDID